MSTTRSGEEPQDTVLIARMRSDNTDPYRNFDDKIKAIPLQDEVHGHSMDNSEIYMDKG